MFGEQVLFFIYLKLALQLFGRAKLSFGGSKPWFGSGKLSFGPSKQQTIWNKRAQDATESLCKFVLK